MEEKKLSELTDQELLSESKKTKTSPITNTLFIGFLVGIIFYSIAKNSWRFLTLIPLFLIYKLVMDSKKSK